MGNLQSLEGVTAFYQLHEKLQKKIKGIPQIAVDLEGITLTLSFDPQTGLEEYEKVTVTPTPENFLLTYTGLYPTAFATFLADKYNKRITRSKLLTQLKQKVERVKRNGQLEVMDEKTGESYIPMIIEEEKSTDYNEIKQALFFFYRVFIDKASQM